MSHPSTPPDAADELSWLLYRQDKVISRRQALRLIGENSLRHKLKSGRWLTVQRGVFVTHTGDLTFRQRCWAAVLGAAAGGTAYLAGVSALRMAGLDRIGGHAVHVLIPGDRRDTRHPTWVLVHRSTRIAAADVRRSNLPPATVPARSMIDAAQWAGSDNAARTIIATVFQRRLVTYDEVRAALERMPTVRRRRLIAQTMDQAAGGAHSLPELEFLALCRRANLPTPSRQVVRVDADGRPRYVDAYFEEAGVLVEIDGAQHMDVAHWWQDMARQNELWVRGERVLRFPAWAIRHDQPRVLAQLAAALNVTLPDHGRKPSLFGRNRP